MNDLISRQAVIEINRSYHGQMPNEVNHRIWKEINELPSAQPKSANELAEKVQNAPNDDFISRKVAIDALDKHLQTTDVPVSYPGIISALTEWLNEVPSAQPDMSEYSDKLWKKAYERGRAEALAQLEEAYISGETEVRPFGSFRSIDHCGMLPEFMQMILEKKLARYDELKKELKKL